MWIIYCNLIIACLTIAIAIVYKRVNEYTVRIGESVPPEENSEKTQKRLAHHRRVNS